MVSDQFYTALPLDTTLAYGTGAGKDSGNVKRQTGKEADSPPDGVRNEAIQL